MPVIVLAYPNFKIGTQLERCFAVEIDNEIVPTHPGVAQTESSQPVNLFRKIVFIPVAAGIASLHVVFISMTG